jgi:hypothetical protein
MAGLLDFRTSSRTAGLNLCATPVASTSARKWLYRTILEDFCLPWSIACEDLTMALHEAVTNACRHGNRMTGIVRIRADYCPATGLVQIDVADTGDGFDTSTPARVEPGGYCCCGRFQIRKCTDHHEYFFRDGWHICRIVKRL